MTELATPLQQQALEWLVAFWSGELGDSERAEFEAWRQTSPAHAAAWESVQRMNSRFSALAPKPAAKALSKKPDLNRRNVLRGVAVLASGGALSYWVQDSAQWHTFTASHTTAVGEQRELTLADGTRIVINTATAFDVHYDDQARRLVLYAGEIMVSTAAESGTRYRPFTVSTPQGTARALGTRFTVRLDGERSRVSVYEGAVEIRPHRANAEVVRVDAGQFSWFDNMQAQLPQPNHGAEAAWTEGRLEVEQMRLADFLAELGRYRQGWLRCDPAIADLPVSGSYPLSDTGLVLESLTQVLPIRVSYVTPYWVTVRMR